MPDNPKVSIVIPTYNYAHFLDETIGSALAQTFGDFELLIVDNCSTDNTREVVSTYLSDPRVRYHVNAKNLGLTGNWNRCLELASGEYIKFLCADDKFDPTIVAKYVEVLDTMPGVSLVTCDKQAFGSKSHETITPVTYLQNGNKSVLSMLENNYCWIGEPTSVMFRRKDLAIGWFSTNFRQYVDWEFWIRLLSVGDCYVIPEKLAWVRFHPATNSKNLQKKRFILCFEEYRLCKDVQQGRYNIDPTGSGIDAAVKKAAGTCIRQAMLKTIPTLYQRESRQAFTQALYIAYHEKMLTDIFGQMFGMLRRKTQQQFRTEP